MRMLTLTKCIARTLIDEIAVDIDAAYRTSRLGCQLSGCEIALPTGVGRPKPGFRLLGLTAAKPPLAAPS
jgi:hypothetical protein